MSARWRNSGTWIAVTTAVVWAVHPLTTSAVNYVSQRTELLMATCFLFTLYAFVRGVEEKASRWWATASIAACALGMASKEVMISAPLAVFLYDGTFVTGRWREAWSKRRTYYAGLAASWVLLGGLIIHSQIAERGVGLDLGVSPLTYALTESRVMVKYLQLALWPHPLVFDYGPVFAPRVLSALPYLALWGGVIAATLFALSRRHVLGFVGGVFLLILAPTSSFVPVIQQPIAESRMYLPLAFIVATAVTTSFAALRRCAWAPMAVAIIAFAWTTIQRNKAYESDVTLWSDTLAKRPDNTRAYANLTGIYLRLGLHSEALTVAQKAVDLRPESATAHHNLAAVLMKSGHFADATKHYEIALQRNPMLADTHYNLGELRLRTGRLDAAREHLETAVRLNSRHARAHNNLSVVLLALERGSDAVAHARAALEINPDLAEAHYDLGNALAHAGQPDAAISSFEAALRSHPAFAKAHNNLGVLHLKAGDRDAAIRHFESALHLDPGYETARTQSGAGEHQSTVK